MKDIPDMWVLRLGSSGKQSVRGKQIGACAKATIDTNNQIVYIGPLAVKPDYQVHQLTHLHTNNNYKQFFYTA